MNTTELFILAVGLSMDAFAVAICKGLSLGKASLKNSCIVGLWFGGFQALMPTIGYFLGGEFHPFDSKFRSLDRFRAAFAYWHKHDQRIKRKRLLRR
mgnify:CR=1 FL=1